MSAPEVDLACSAPKSAPRKDRFSALFEDGGDAAGYDDEFAHAVPEPAIPVVRRPIRRAVPGRRKADNAGLLIGLGGLSLLAVIVLIIVLEQRGEQPTRTSPALRRPAPVERPAPAEPAPPVARPERPVPPSRPPRFDKQPLLDEMTKSTVDAIYQNNASVKARFRELWESQLQTLLTQETKGMREEQEIRSAVKRVCDAWSAETKKFLAGESAPPPPADAIDGATQGQAGGDEAR